MNTMINVIYLHIDSLAQGILLQLSNSVSLADLLDHGKKTKYRILSYFHISFCQVILG